MKKIIVLIALVAMTGIGMGMQAQNKVPAYPGVIERVQPNGDTIRTYLRGDERMHWMMTEDGWQIVETKKGWFKYAKLNRKGEIVAGCRKVRNIEDRSKCETRWLEKKGIKKN